MRLKLDKLTTLLSVGNTPGLSCWHVAPQFPAMWSRQVRVIVPQDEGITRTAAFLSDAFSRSPGFPVDNACGLGRPRHWISRLRDCPLSVTERFPSHYSGALPHDYLVTLAMWCALVYSGSVAACRSCFSRYSFV